MKALINPKIPLKIAYSNWPGWLGLQTLTLVYAVFWEICSFLQSALTGLQAAKYGLNVNTDHSP